MPASRPQPPQETGHDTAKNGSGKSAKVSRSSLLTPGGLHVRPEDAQGPAYDPFGIYGTRSAHRIRASRRRRIVQKVGVTAGFFALTVALASLIFVPRVQVISGERLGVAAPPGALPVAATDKEGSVLLAPGEGGELLRFDPKKGTATSCLDTDFPLRASPLVRGAIAFVPSENGVMTALDWRHGRVVWQRATGASLTARPAMVEWQTTVQRPVTPPASVEDASATDATDATAVADPAEAAAARTETVTKTQKILVAGNDDGLLAGLDAGTGKVVWKRSTGAPVGNGVVAVPHGSQATVPYVLVPLLQSAASTGGLWCLDGRTGALLWKYPGNGRVQSPQIAPPAVDAQDSRVFCADDTGTLSCLDLKTGRKIWKKFARSQNPHSQEIVMLRGEPLFRRYAFGAVVVLGGNDGVVRCFSAQDGMLLWTYDAGAPVRARPLPLIQNLPAASDTRELLVIGCDSSSLPVLDPQTGRPICKLRASDAAPFGVVPIGERLCTITASGVVEEFVF